MNFFSKTKCVKCGKENGNLICRSCRSFVQNFPEKNNVSVQSPGDRY